MTAYQYPRSAGRSQKADVEGAAGVTRRGYRRPVSADPPAEPRPRAVALAYLAAFGTGDPDAIAAFVSDDFFNEHVAALGSSSRGRDEYRTRLPGFLAQFPGLRYDVEEVVAEGNLVVVAYTMRAAWNGEHDITIRGAFHFDVVDGLIARRTDYWDSLEFLRQTGQA